MGNEFSPIIRKNTITNYVLVLVKLIQGILIVRWMIHSLGDELYGFWGLLWSIFVYVLVLDFGFSKAAQKCTAERLFEEDIERYNRIVSSVFLMQWVMSLVIVLGTVGCMIFLPVMTRQINPESIAYCRLSLLVFGLGIAVTFPTGMFPEILIGLKLIFLRNYVLIFGKILELLGILLIFHLQGSLLSLVVFTVVLNLTLNLLMFRQLKQQIPGFRLSLLGDWHSLRSLFHFSAFTYLASIGNLISRKSDRFILSFLFGLGPVGIYQIGSRIPEIAETMTMQYQDNVTPCTAELCKQNRIDELRWIVLRGIKLTCFLAAGGVLLGIVLSADAMRFLFNVDNPLALEVCRLMLVNVFYMVTVRSFSTRMMMMSGHHQMYCVVCWVEAILNLSLSLFLVYRIGLLGVVFGTMIPGYLLAFGIMLPFCAKLVHFSYLRLLWKYYARPLINGGIAALLVMLIQRNLPEMSLFWRLSLSACCGGVVYLILSVFLYFDAEDRHAILKLLRRRTV